MPVFIGQRDDVVTTLAGHVIGFKAGQETFVPEDGAVIKACSERGHSPKKDEPAPKPAPAVKPEAK